MDALPYESIARICTTASLLLFIAIFVIMLVYVFGFANRERFEADQKAALDLAPDTNSRGKS
jgi:cbb3-type cytochrome oxidase subunit 3